MTNINIHNTDIIDYLKNYKGEKFHAVISDPPYGLAFMGKEWDKYTPKQYQEWVTEWASLLLEHLYPGAVCMFFGGTRTYHRLATGLEDAGFEIFDSMVWNYGSGFPKSHNISKAIDKSFDLEREIVGQESNFGVTKLADGKVGYGDYAGSWNVTKPNSELAQTWNGYGTALKPAFEPIVLCRKPRGKETYANCVLNYGSSALNIDGCRVETDDDLNGGGHRGKYSGSTFLVSGGKNKSPYKQPTGRYPANFGLICNCESNPCECENIDSNSKYFYTAKASRKERNLGLGRLPEVETQVTRWSGDGMPLRQNGTERKMPKAQNNHPTVKPIKLTEYLSKLLLPPIDNSSILIPFAGSGSEIIGAMLSGWNVITALEISDEYCNIAQNRVDYWKEFNDYSEAMKG